MHLQFAYYESSLVVEFLIDQFGAESLKKILVDLGNGVEINQAIEAHTAPLEEIEKGFVGFARHRAETLAPGLDWENLKPSARLDSDSPDKQTTNYYALTRRAKRLLAEKKYSEAEAPLNELLKLYPSDTSADNAHKLLAESYRNLNQTNREREVLIGLAA